MAPPSHLALVRSFIDHADSARAVDRRLHTRRSTAELPWLDAARLRYGPSVEVIDLSHGGAQIETPGYQLQPGSTVVVEINGTGLVVPAQVVRCQVSRLAPSAIYRGALEFKRAISFPDAARPEPDGSTHSAFSGPRRLSIAPTRWSESTSGSGLMTPAESHGQLVRAAAPATSAPVASADLPMGWYRVVVRYADGRLLKGYSQQFTASSDSLQVWPKPNAPVMTRITVPLAYLKAVFFVRDFDGHSDRVERHEAEHRERGRAIAVTFLDGETLVGTTTNYHTDALGFFMRPADEASNNTRIFVGSRAIRHVTFP